MNFAMIRLTLRIIEFLFLVNTSTHILQDILNFVNQILELACIIQLKSDQTAMFQVYLSMFITNHNSDYD